MSTTTAPKTVGTPTPTPEKPDLEHQTKLKEAAKRKNPDPDYAEFVNWLDTGPDWVTWFDAFKAGIVVGLKRRDKGTLSTLMQKLNQVIHEGQDAAQLLAEFVEEVAPNVLKKEASKPPAKGAPAPKKPAEVKKKSPAEQAKEANERKKEATKPAADANRPGFTDKELQPPVASKPPVK